MPKLNEFIGSLVSSITNARVMSDIQTVKVAEEYAKHNLLKHFSIPRMRVDGVEITIPIALNEIEEQTDTEFQPIDYEKFNVSVYDQLVNNLGLPKLPNELSAEFRSEIIKQSQILEQNLRITKNLGFLKTYIKDLISEIFYLIKKYNIEEDFNKKIDVETISIFLEKRLSQEIKILTQNKSIGNLNVIVEADKLREQKSENLIYIKLKITEEGMEWNRTEYNNGEIEAKLLPE